MNLNEPSVELDLAVAKAVGLECTVLFLPSRDIRDAIEAAKKVCQPREGHGRGFRMEIEWDVINYEALPGADIEAVSVELVCVKTERTLAEAMAPTLPLAICAAILGLHSKEHPAPKE